MLLCPVDEQTDKWTCVMDSCADGQRHNVNKFAEITVVYKQRIDSSLLAAVFNN